MQLESFNVEVKYIRRSNGNGKEITVETPLAEGDVVVLIGQPASLTNAQNALLIGRLAIK